MELFRLPRYSLLAMGFFLLLVLELYGLRALAPLDRSLSDSLVARHALASSPDPDIVIVDIDESSLNHMAPSVGRWPWPRSLHAELIEAIGAQGPAAIVFDVLFSDPDLTRPESDQYFSEVIRAHSNLYFPMLRLESKSVSAGLPLAQYGAALGITPGPGALPQAKVSLLTPLPVMLESGRVGAHNATADADGVVRRYPLYLDAQGWRIPSLPAKVVAGLGYPVPTQLGNIHLNWHGGALSHRRVSYADLYQDAQRSQPQRPNDEFRQKIVIIGATAHGLHDILATPVDGFHPGVEILATAIDNLKNANPMRVAPLAVSALLGLVLLAALGLALARQRHLPVIGLALAVASLGAIGASYAALNWRWLATPLAALVLAWACYFTAAVMAYVSERKARQQAVDVFGRFLDPRVVRSLVAQGETAQTLGSGTSEISVLFSDIRGFTSLSETHSAQQVVDLLNRHFSLQTGVVFKFNGTLDKYIGDAIMAFWGAPTEQADHAVRAVHAALAMSQALDEFKRQNAAMGQATGAAIGADLEIGIGVHSGPAVVGFIGSEHRQEYTAIGDTVNLASRIEGATKGISRVLISEDCKQLCEKQAKPGECPFGFVDRGLHTVKGRTQSVRLYQPVMACGPFDQPGGAATASRDSQAGGQA